MKALSSLFALSALAVATVASAALESAKLDPNNVLPSFPLSMQVAGITRGDVIIATSIDAEGKVGDSLVLGYTNEALVRPTLEAMKTWRANPARLDGEAVPVQIVLSFNFTLQGAVITSNAVNHFFFDHFERNGDGALVYRLHNPREIDSVPAPINPVKPRYATEAAKQGIHGKVLVDFYIDENGNVRMPSTVDTGASPYLVEQAVAALREWKFTPPTHQGKPVLVAATQEFSFGEGK